MENSRSSNDTNSRCHCGFWGSPQTLGLCSVCYQKACRNQSHNSSLNLDAGRSNPGHCNNHLQQGSNQQESVMDSRHFPSRSTTDNLPSSLSSPPGERATLSAAVSDSGASTSTTVGCSSVVTNGAASSTSVSSSHLSNRMGPESKINPGGADLIASNSVINSATPVSSTCGGSVEEQQRSLPFTPNSSNTDTLSSASTDLSYDPECDTSVVCSSGSSDSCASEAVSSTDSTTANAGLDFPTFTPPHPSCASSDLNEKSVTSSSTSELSPLGCTQQVNLTESNASTSQPLIPNTAASITQSSAVACKVTSIDSKSATSTSFKNKDSSNMETMDKEVSSACAGMSSSGNAVEPYLKADNGVIQPAPSIDSPAERGIKRSRDEMESSSATSSPAASPQKNKKRCFVCSCKLELAQRTIGRCRCDRIFCALHRLPELHDCEFNHKEDGRREAREKMVKPTRHLGPSYRREENS